MLKFIKKIVIFFVIVAVVDVAMGYFCRYLNSHAKGGDTRTHYDIAMNMQADILLFGSSRCNHHYVPKIITDSLGLSSYNCGLEGNGILYQYSRLQMILDRFTPKMIIYDVSNNFDLKTDDYSKYLGWQRRFYDISGVREVFSDINPMEQYKMYSQLYRYNSDFIQMLSDNVHPIQADPENGYEAVHRKMEYEPKGSNIVPDAIKWDATKKKYFIKFYEQCKKNNIILIVAYSPLYHAQSSKVFAEMTEFCTLHKITLLDHYTDSDFVNNKDFFYDTSHMNADGATAYTKKVASELKQMNLNIR